MSISMSIYIYVVVQRIFYVMCSTLFGAFYDDSTGRSEFSDRLLGLGLSTKV